jgi:hypothetical protein
MKIISKTPTALTILLSPVLLRLCGVMFILIGSGIVFYTLTHVPGWLPWTTFIFPIIGMVLLCSCNVSVAFDKSLDRVSIEICYFFKNNKKVYPLSNVLGIKIEEAMIANAQNYRVVLTMKDGQMVPLTYYYDPYLSSSIALAKEIITFLQLDQELLQWEQRNTQQRWGARVLFVIGLMIIVMLLLVGK